VDRTFDGRNSKRDDLGFARHDSLGQFGFGLLSAFLVATEVHLLTRSAISPVDTGNPPSRPADAVVPT
jgi:HSP90 family molecular chaperone